MVPQEDPITRVITKKDLTALIINKKIIKEIIKKIIKEIIKVGYKIQKAGGINPNPRDKLRHNQ